MNKLPFNVKIKNFFYSIYNKTIGIIKRKYKNYYRIYVSNKNINNVKNNDEFINSIQLARFVNTIRSIQRNYLNIPNNGSYPNMKDRIESQFLYASAIYEIIQSFSKISSQFKNLSSWKSNSVLIKYLNNEKNSNNSYYNKVIKQIRNRVMFHFDKNIIIKYLNKKLKSNCFDIAISESVKNIDIVFTIVDDLIIDYILSNDDTKKDDLVKYQYLLEYLLDISEKIVKVCNDCIIEIWTNNVTFSKSKLGTYN